MSIAFTADACLDDKAPRHLFIAGDVLSCNDFVEIMTALSGEKYSYRRIIRAFVTVTKNLLL